MWDVLPSGALGSMLARGRGRLGSHPCKLVFFKGKKRQKKFPQEPEGSLWQLRAFAEQRTETETVT